MGGKDPVSRPSYRWAENPISSRRISGLTHPAGALLELPTSHRVPVGWLRAHASPPIVLRIATDVLPAGAVSDDELAALRHEVAAYKGVTQVAKKQRPAGIWASNMLGIAPSKSLGIKDVGTVFQYRRLLQQIGRAHLRTPLTV